MDQLADNDIHLHSLAISPVMVKILYSTAYQHYYAGHYTKAEQLFRILTIKEPLQSKHWLGLGAALQMLCKYDAALVAYQMAASYNGEDASAHLYAAECLFSLKHHERAISALEYAEVLAKCYPQASGIKEKLQFLSACWKNGAPQIHQSMNKQP